jgi:[ribosomal protein S5]-alanine N-acetyltransferase
MADKPQHPPTVELDGVRLRPLRMGDAAELYAYLRDPAVTGLTSYPEVTVPMVEAMIERALARWAAGDLSKWGVALQHDDHLVGTCGFNEWSRVHRWAELAFDLAQAHWGKGLMRQAVAAVLQWTYHQDQVHRVQAFVRVDNRRSERLLERSGFVREGCLRSYRVCRGQPHDFYVYGLLRSDWVSNQEAASFCRRGSVAGFRDVLPESAACRKLHVQRRCLSPDQQPSRHASREKDL